jgi:hypothetical protein
MSWPSSTPRSDLTNCVIDIRSRRFTLGLCRFVCSMISA